MLNRVNWWQLLIDQFLLNYELSLNLVVFFFPSLPSAIFFFVSFVIFFFPFTPPLRLSSFSCTSFSSGLACPHGSRKINIKQVIYGSNVCQSFQDFPLVDLFGSREYIVRKLIRFPANFLVLTAKIQLLGKMVVAVVSTLAIVVLIDI